MIKHFVVRDFKDQIVFWIIAIIVVFGTLLMWIYWPLGRYLGFFPIQMLGMYALMMPFMLSGSTYRSQHIMSRTYLLSLPVSRLTLYNLIILRGLILWIPCLILLFMFPLFVSDKDFSIINIWIYPLSIILGVVALQNASLLSMLIQEETMRSVSKDERISGHIRSMGILMLSGFIVFFLGTQSISSGSAVWAIVYLFLIIFVGMGNYFLARKKWIGE